MLGGSTGDGLNFCRSPAWCGGLGPGVSSLVYVAGVGSVHIADGVVAVEVLPPPDPSSEPRPKRKRMLHRLTILPALPGSGKRHGLGVQQQSGM